MVEKELLDGELKVVHHCGHGPDGLLISPGSAEDVVRLVKEVLEGIFNETFKYLRGLVGGGGRSCNR